MLSRNPAIRLFSLAIVLSAAVTRAETLEVAGARLHLDWRGDYTLRERDKTRLWLRHAGFATATLYGQLPREDITLILERVPAAREPVPFARVIRSRPPAIRFYLDPTRPLGEFTRDWTAVHELSHLYIPYPGDQAIWLSEGLASYYQNVLQARAGVLTADEAWLRLRQGFKRGQADKRHNALSLGELSPRMWETGSYMRVYWSGAAYFLEADLQLRHQSDNRQSLDSVIATFVTCCLAATGPGSAAELVAALDRAAESNVFSALYARYVALRGMPDFNRLLPVIGGRDNGSSAATGSLSIHDRIMRPATDPQRAAAAAARALAGD
jgi:hypothetical protein